MLWAKLRPNDVMAGLSDRVHLLCQQVEQLTAGIEDCGRIGVEATALVSLKLLEYSVRSLSDLKALQPEDVGVALLARKPALMKALDSLRYSEQRARLAHRDDVEAAHIVILKDLAKLLDLKS
jgi:hypothetical protein